MIPETIVKETWYYVYKDLPVSPSLLILPCGRKCLNENLKGRPSPHPHKTSQVEPDCQYCPVPQQQKRIEDICEVGDFGG